MTAPQRRYLHRPAAPIKLRENSDGAAPTITGYAAVFYDPADPGTAFRLWGKVEERIMPAAFDKALARDDVRALFNHNSACILGRTTAGTLRLTTDARGLRYEIDPPDTQAARDLIASIRRGDVTGSSFAFIPDSIMDRKDGDKQALEIHDCQLFDVGPVTYPAYPATEAGLRSDGSIDAVRAAFDARRAAAEIDALAVDMALSDAD